MRCSLLLAVALCFVLVPMGSVDAGLVAQYHLDGDATDSAAAFDGNINGGALFVPSPYGGGLAIDLNGGQYIDTVATNAIASNLGIGGNNPKTMSAWARPEAFNNAAIFEVGSTGSAGQMYSLRTLGTDAWRAQFWSTPDFDFTTPGSLNNWGWYVLTHDGSIGRAYRNGVIVGQKASSLNTNDGRALEIGRYGGGTTFVGQIDEVNVYDEALTPAQVKAQYEAMGGYAEGFEGYGAQIDTDVWYTSGGMNSTRLRSNRGSQGPYLLGTFDNTPGDPAGNVRNVFNVGQDAVTSLTWGQPLRVLDGSGALEFLLAGGSFPVNEGSQRSGGAGIALWDIAANDFVRDGGTIRFTTRSGNGGLQGQSISLAGLEGRIVTPVLYDREIGSYGWSELDSLTALPGVVSPLDLPHRVVLEYAFDQSGDYMGWTGDVGSFAIGDSNAGGGLLTRHINLTGSFTRGAGFLSSALPGAWDTPTGVLRSPDFTLAGDILEFYIAGGGSTRPNLSFELWVDLAGDDVYSLERIAQHQVDSSDFDYEFWTIGDLYGLSAYLQLVDQNGGTWGHIEVDAIRMVDFAVPEPGTMALTGMALAGLARHLRRRRRR